MAIAPQKPTRKAGHSIFAPPSDAPSRPEGYEEEEGRDRHRRNQRAVGREDRDHGGERRAEREGGGRSEGRLNRIGARRFGEAEFVAGVGGERVLRRQRFGDRAGKSRLEAALFVDFGEFGELFTGASDKARFSRAMSAASRSACELTETYSPPPSTSRRPPSRRRRPSGPRPGPRPRPQRRRRGSPSR